MRKPGGYAVWTDPGAKRMVEERDTFTCCHCNRVVIVKPKAPPETLGGFCRLCMAPICPKCVSGSCTPFEKRVEAAEAKNRFRRSLGLEG